MNKEINIKSNIWWKLAKISAISTIVLIVLLGYRRVEELDWPLWCVIVSIVFTVISNLYLSVFSLWHWKTRYKGQYPFAWCLFFVYCWFVVPSLVYFFSHILPDINGKGIYAKPPDIPELSSLQSKYKIVKSFCFVSGWVLICLGIIYSIRFFVAELTISDLFRDALVAHSPKDITDATAQAVIVYSRCMTFTSIMLFISSICIALGGLLIYASQRIRWRLLEEEEKEEIKKSFNKEDALNSDSAVAKPE